MGGRNSFNYNGEYPGTAYHVGMDYNIYGFCTCIPRVGFKVYTLEEFEKEFPFKVGDKVKDCSDDEIGIILGFIDIDGELMYVVDFEKSGHANMPTEELKPYKEMERNITLTLDKAKEWYKQGGDLK